MKISELQAELSNALRSHGDIDILVDGYSGLHEIEDVGVDADDTGFMIWIGGVSDGL